MNNTQEPQVSFGTIIGFNGFAAENQLFHLFDNIDGVKNWLTGDQIFCIDCLTIYNQFIEENCNQTRKIPDANDAQTVQGIHEGISSKSI